MVALLLVAATLLYLAVLLWFYPLTLRLVYRQGQLSLAWLPRVCGGYAAPRALVSWPYGHGRSAGAKQKRARFASLRRALSRSLLKRLVRYIRLNKLDFCFMVGFFGYAECIFHIRGGDIIEAICSPYFSQDKGERKNGQ